MKSIRDFIEGKIRRTESEASLSLVPGEAHPELGPCAGVLRGPRGQITFYELGAVLEGGDHFRYQDIARVDLEPSSPNTCNLDIILESGPTKRLASSPIGAEVVHATLRWIGNTRLRRKVAD
jgi:hypothetical protein